MTTLSELLEQKTADALLADALTKLAGKDFEVTDWNEGGVVRTQLEVEAEVLADAYKLIPLIASGGFIDLAAGQWLDLVAKNFFDLERKAAVFAEGSYQLTCEAAQGPHTVEVGDLWLTTAAGKRFTNTTGGVIPAGGTLTVTIKAESPGSAYNVPTASITTIQTPLPGVTGTNPVGWLTTSGADEESDKLLRARCKARWGELGSGSTRSAYEFWALTAHASVTKVRIRDDNPRGQGTVDVVIWGEGGLGAGVVDAVDDYIQERIPLTANVLVESATEVVVTIEATVRVKASKRATAEAEVEELITQLQKATDIGGTLYKAAVVEALMAPDGVENAVVTAPAADTVLTAAQAVTLVLDLTWEEV